MLINWNKHSMKPFMYTLQPGIFCLLHSSGFYFFFFKESPDPTSLNWFLDPLIQRLPWWFSGKESACTVRRHRRPGFNPWVRKIPWKRKWQPTPVFLPGKVHGQRSLVGYSPWGFKELDTTEHTHTHTVIYNTNFSKLQPKGRFHPVTSSVYVQWAKAGFSFFISKWLGRIQRRIFYDIWKLGELKFQSP